MKNSLQNISSCIQRYSSMFSLICLFSLILGVVHLLNKDIDVIKYPISWYLETRYGFLLKIGYGIFGLAEILLAYQVIIRKYRYSKVISMLLFISGIGITLSGIFVMDHDESTTLPSEYIHVYSAALQFLLFPVIAILWGVNVKNSALKLYSVLSGVGGGLLFCFIVLVISNEQNKLMNIYGLLQRINVVIILAWFLTVTNYCGSNKFNNKLE